MKIVINAMQYKPDCSGIGMMMRELFGPFTAVTKRSCRLVLPKNSPPFSCAESAERVEAPCTYGEGLRRIMFQTFRLGVKYCKDAILLTVDSKVPLILPKSCRVVPLVTDLAVFRMAENYQSSRVLLWRLQYRYLRRRADSFLTISEFTKREMTALLGIPPEHIDVVPCAAAEELRRVTDESRLRALREKYHLERPYILFVGNLNPRKNLQRLIAAFDLMKRETSLPHELIIAGGQGWKFNVPEALEGVAAKAAVRFLGYVPDEDMPALYSAADMFAFPTLYEGFGIPVIEAQRCGAPVLTSNVSALPEVGGDAAIYVDPYDVPDMARGMAELLMDRARREELVHKGYENAKRFSWEASAEKLNDIIEGKIRQWNR